VEWGQSGRADRAEDPLWQERGACQGVRAPTGMAHDRELLDAQRIGDAGDVSGH